MRKKFLDLSRSRVDPEKLRLARQLSGMFSETQQVYMLTSGDHFYLFSSSRLAEFLDVPGKIHPTDPNIRRYLNMNIYPLRDLEDGKNDIQRAADHQFVGWTPEMSRV